MISFKKLWTLILGITIFIFAITLILPAKNAQAAPSKSIRVPILMYHYIGNNPNPNDKARNTLSISPEKFDQQMGYLAQNGYEPITLDTLFAGLSGQVNLPTKPIVITFDDGYIDLYYNAFGILKKYNFKAVAFIPTGLVGTSYYANWNQLKELQNSGLISMQAHTVSHPTLTVLSPAKIEEEFRQSKKTLEEKFGIPVNFVAYPNGILNANVQKIAQKVGYVGGIGTWYSVYPSLNNRYNLPRVRITGQMDLKTFVSRL